MIKNQLLYWIFLFFFFSVTVYAQKVGIYTGTFDPPHIAHKKIVDIALKKKLIDIVFVVPDDKTPFKPNKSPIKDRLKMVQLMFKDQKNVKYLDQSMSDELKTGEMWNVYSVIKHHTHAKNISIMMGADTFEKYKEFVKGFSDTDFSLIVFTRGASTKIPNSFNGQKINRIELSMDNVSSSKVREALKSGKAVSDLTPEVLQYIKEHGLYQDPK